MSQRNFIDKVTTSATGANFVTFSDRPCDALRITTGATAIDYRLNGSGNVISIPSFTTRTIPGITNASEVGIRRTDTSGTQIDVPGEVLSF